MDYKEEKFKSFTVKSSYKIYNLVTGKSETKYVLKQFPLLVFEKKELVKLDSLKFKKWIKG